MDAALSMPRCQVRLRVVLGSAALIPSYLARIMPLGSYTVLTEARDLGLRRVLQSAAMRGVVDERAWAIACLSVSPGGFSYSEHWDSVGIEPNGIKPQE